MHDPGKLIQQENGTAGSFGKITGFNDLPADGILIDFIKQAMHLNEAENKKPIVKKETAAKASLEMPADFAAVLAANSIANDCYNKFSPSQKREYLEWILDAKAEATRQKRIKNCPGMDMRGQIKTLEI